MMQERQKDWVNILFLSLTPVIGVLGTAAYAIAYGVRWWEPTLFFVLFGLVSFSVTAGYHRCFAHKAYVSHPALQAFYLFFGAMALQNSALKWSSDHRDHHRHVDRDWDPYSIKRGGLWAHILWLFYKEPAEHSYENVPDLKENRLVRWQYRLNNWIGIVVGLGLPTLIGALFGRPLGGLLWGGFLRIVLIHHTTFLVNSVAHLYGTRPYTEENSARDNGLLAFVTNGEGYHNFHHKFPSDFRNGVRWYQWDPTKWLIAVLRFVGLARDLRKTPKAVIEKSRLRMKLQKAEARLREAPAGIAEMIRPRLDRAQQALDRAVDLWHEVDAKRRDLLARGRTASSDIARSWKETLRESRASLSAARQEWRAAARLLAQIPEGV
ncbi:MAG TPA: fatty acid desaturase [Thermoanaerobaculia bacterium]|nr:fatty acid desaturase [Thermoanaerobaculia bacterium]